MMMKRKHPKCRSCDMPGQYRGVLYQVTNAGSMAKTGRIKTKRIVEPMCERHYLENTHGLWPFGCTKACVRAHMRKTGIVLDEDDLIVWLKLETVLGPRGTCRPNCPWCGNRLRPKAPKNR
jgi:hypothetical protein